MQRLGAGWAGRRIPPDLPVAVAKQVPAVTAGNARCAEAVGGETTAPREEGGLSKAARWATME